MCKGTITINGGDAKLGTITLDFDNEYNVGMAAE